MPSETRLRKQVAWQSPTGGSGRVPRHACPGSIATPSVKDCWSYQSRLEKGVSLRECPESPYFEWEGIAQEQGSGPLMRLNCFRENLQGLGATLPTLPTQPKVRKRAIFIQLQRHEDALSPHAPFGGKRCRSPCVPLVVEHFRESLIETKKWQK